jgi:translation initiation factor 3 subunit C
LIKMCDSVIDYLKKHDDQQKIAHIGLIKLEHIYYKHDSIYEKTKEALKGKTDKLKELYFIEGSSADVVNDLAVKVITNCDRRMKIKATLLHVYHLSIHNKFYEAKDLLMKARLSQIITKQQISN